jgi:hypothetical protein
MRTMARRSWSAEFSDVLRFAAIIVGVLLVAYIGYVVVIAALGTIQTETNTNLEIDTGQLDRGPGTPTAVIANLVQSEPELVGWTAGTDLTARVSLLDQNDETACFEILAGDVYVAEVTGGEGEWRFAGLVHNTGPDQWETVRGSVSSDCLSQIGEG